MLDYDTDISINLMTIEQLEEQNVPLEEWYSIIESNRHDLIENFLEEKYTNQIISNINNLKAPLSKIPENYHYILKGMLDTLSINAKFERKLKSLFIKRAVFSHSNQYLRSQYTRKQYYLRITPKDYNFVSYIVRNKPELTKQFLDIFENQK